MEIWLDAQLSPGLAKWIAHEFKLVCHPVRDLGLRDAPDLDIFQKARQANVIVMTKDRDFVELLFRFGPPPKVIWLTCGNTSNGHLRSIFATQLPIALHFLQSGDELVEIT